MACDGLMAVDYAQVHALVNACVHSTRRTVHRDHLGMKFLAKNAKDLRQVAEMNQTQFGEKLGIHQTSVGRMEKGAHTTSIETVIALARYAKVSVDDVLNRDLAIEGASSPSQAPTLDLSKLGHALTSIDMALSNRKIRGSMGKLAKTLAFAYRMTASFPDMETRTEQREAYDLLVKHELVGELDGQRDGGVIEGREGRDRSTAAGTPAHRNRTRRGAGA